MLKLYKRQPDHTLYWETWEKEGQTCVHFGRVGERGESLWFPPALREALVARLERDVAALREKGYVEMENDNLVALVLQYRVEGMGTPQDLKRRHQMEDLLDECLGWSGNGRCDGGDIGSGAANLFCCVVDAPAAVETVVNVLRQEKLLAGVVMAYRASDDDDYRVLWPADFAGPFTAGKAASSDG